MTQFENDQTRLASCSFSTLCPPLTAFYLALTLDWFIDFIFLNIPPVNPLLICRAFQLSMYCFRKSFLQGVLKKLCLQRGTKLILWVLYSRYFRYAAGLLQINVSWRLFTLSHLQLSEISSTHFVDIGLFRNFCYWKRNL